MSITMMEKKKYKLTESQHCMNTIKHIYFPCSGRNVCKNQSINGFEYPERREPGSIVACFSITGQEAPKSVSII